MIKILHTILAINCENTSCWGLGVVCEGAVPVPGVVVAVGVEGAVVSVPGLAGASVPCVVFGVAGAAGEGGVVLDPPPVPPPNGGKGPSPILEHAEI
jgi:hypothetical protein